MELLLIFLVALVSIGLVTDRMTARLYWLIIGLSVLTILLYYFPHRFMR